MKIPNPNIISFLRKNQKLVNFIIVLFLRKMANRLRRKRKKIRVRCLIKRYLISFKTALSVLKYSITVRKCKLCRLANIFSMSIVAPNGLTSNSHVQTVICPLISESGSSNSTSKKQLLLFLPSRIKSKLLEVIGSTEIHLVKIALKITKYVYKQEEDLSRVMRSIRKVLES